MNPLCPSTEAGTNDGATQATPAAVAVRRRKDRREMEDGDFISSSRFKVDVRRQNTRGTGPASSREKGPPDFRSDLVRFGPIWSNVLRFAPWRRSEQAGRQASGRAFHASRFSFHAPEFSTAARKFDPLCPLCPLCPLFFSFLAFCSAKRRIFGIEKSEARRAIFRRKTHRRPMMAGVFGVFWLVLRSVN